MSVSNRLPRTRATPARRVVPSPALGSITLHAAYKFPSHAPKGTEALHPRHAHLGGLLVLEKSRSVKCAMDAGSFSCVLANTKNRAHVHTRATTDRIIDTMEDKLTVPVIAMTTT